MGKEFDIEDEKFETLLADKRHRELTNALKNISIHLSNKDDNELAAAINDQASKIGDLVSVMLNAPKPEVKVDLNPKEFVTSVQKICEDIVASNNKVIEALENRLLPESFVLVKVWNGATESVKVNYKPANQIAIKK